MVRDHRVLSRPLVIAAIAALKDYAYKCDLTQHEACDVAGINYNQWMNAKSGKKEWTLDLITGALNLANQHLVVRNQAE